MLESTLERDDSADTNGNSGNLAKEKIYNDVLMVLGESETTLK